MQKVGCPHDEPAIANRALIVATSSTDTCTQPATSSWLTF